MTAKIEDSDLQKALGALQELAKGHGSRGTVSTEVETMVGESGATQIFHTPSDSDPGSWAGSSWRGEGWEDSIDANGTDLKSVSKLGKSIAEGIVAKSAKGQKLEKRELDFVAKGGMAFLKKDDEEDKKVEKAAGHEDAAEDKKQIKNLVKPEAMKGDVKKSLLDHAGEDATVSRDLDVSEFLASWARVMHKSLSSTEARVSDRVLTAIAKSSAEQAEVQKSLAEALANLGEVLAAQQQRIDSMEAGPARAPKSQMSVAKSQYDAREEAPALTKAQVGERLYEMLQKSECTPMDVMRFDSTGEISPELARKVTRN